MGRRKWSCALTSKIGVFGARGCQTLGSSVDSTDDCTVSSDTVTCKELWKKVSRPQEVSKMYGEITSSTECAGFRRWEGHREWSIFHFVFGLPSLGGVRCVRRR